ncbi:MAG: DUF4405 domain-containing protein [Anaerolineales bacterium]
MPKTNLAKFSLDALTFIAFLIAMDPRSSGITVHEWMTIALAATLIVHLLLNWDWILQTTQKLFRGKLNGARVNYILNWLLFTDGVLLMLSGVLISQSVAPALGWNLPQNFAWRELHSLSANIALLILGLHIAMHWNWIATTFKRLFARNAPQPASVSLGEEA